MFLKFSTLILSTVGIIASAGANEELACQQQLDHFVGLQNHVQKEGESSVPQFQLGLTTEQLDALIAQKGSCAAWQTLVNALQKQHGQVLDATEKKTGKPAPVR